MSVNICSIIYPKVSSKILNYLIYSLLLVTTVVGLTSAEPSTVSCADFGSYIGPTSAKVISTLTGSSRGYFDTRFNPVDGLTYNDNGQAELRDVMYSALFYAIEGNLSRTEQALNALFGHQHRDTTNPTSFGFFPWFAGDENIDGNATRQIALYLIVLIREHENQLPVELQKTLIEALGMIITGYRNLYQTEAYVSGERLVTAVEAFVLQTGGDLIGDPEASSLGYLLWSYQVAEETTDGGYRNYTSDNYLNNDLLFWGTIARYATDATIRDDAKCLALNYWASLTRLYHAPTHQLSAPHRRAFVIRMLYDRVAGQTMLYYGSNGRIPFSFSEQLDPNTEHRKAFLTLYSERLWPDAWVEEALSAPQYPETFFQLIDDLDDTDSLTFQQMTVYQDQRISLGSINSTRLNDDTRPLAAFVTNSTGDVAVLDLVGGVRTGQIFFASVQSNRSVLVTLAILDNYSDQVGTTIEPASVLVRWISVPSSSPYIERWMQTTSEAQLDVKLFDISTQLVLMPAVETSLGLSMEASGEPNVPIGLVASAPIQFLQENSPARYHELVTFGLFVNNGSVASDDTSLNSITYREVGDHRHYSWQSPDGLLELEVPFLTSVGSRITTWQRGVSQWIHGQRVAPINLFNISPLEESRGVN